MEHSSLRAFPGMFGSSDTIVEHVTIDAVIGIVAVLAALARELGSLKKDLQASWLLVLLLIGIHI